MLDADLVKDPTASLSALSPVFDSPLNCDRIRNLRLAALYQRGQQQQWNGMTDLDWKIESRFGSRLPSNPLFALRCFENSPLARYGSKLWDLFRWEFQSWMISQFLPGEQAAMIAAARLVEVVPDADARLCLAGQVGDEARHVEVFARYLSEKVPEPYAVAPSLAALLRDTLGERRWDFTVLGMQILVETLALAAFRLADRSFHDDLIREICRRVAQDEVRHVSFGVLSLRSLYSEMTEAELKEREDFVLDAIQLVRQRFMLEEIWDRLGINRDEGVAFAKTNELMVQYRQIICANLVTSLLNIGLMTRRLTERFIQLDLLAARHRFRIDRRLHGLS